MKIIELRELSVDGNAKVHFIRIDPEDLDITLNDILTALMDLSWLSKFDEEYLSQCFHHRATKTIADIQAKFAVCSDDKITSEAGEYVVSAISKNAISINLGYMNIPLAELLGQKVSGNPGFDFHSQNIETDTVIFGEAKYIASKSAYESALTQIGEFIRDKKDIDDIEKLEHFCTKPALRRVAGGIKGFAAAFSARSTSSDKLLSLIQTKPYFQALLNYEEVILVAVNL